MSTYIGRSVLPNMDNSIELTLLQNLMVDKDLLHLITVRFWCCFLSHVGCNTGSVVAMPKTSQTCDVH